MPIYWKIDSQLRLVELEATGRLTLTDCLNAVQVVERASALGYRKLLDARRATLDVTADEVMRLVVEFRVHHDRAQVGPLAVITAASQPEEWAKILGALAAADRPFRLFTRERAARNWLHSFQRIG